MSNIFIRPDHLHQGSKVLSATEESGRIPGNSTSASSNKGTLRLRLSGSPETDLDLVGRLQTGGDPTGYTLDDSGKGSGAALSWRHSTDSSDEFRGYVDSIYLVRNEVPTTYSSTSKFVGRGRELPNGNFGFIVSPQAGAGSHQLVSIETDGTIHNYDIAPPYTVTTTLGDFAILPNGRLIALVDESTTVAPPGFAGNYFASYFSDDNGATWTRINPGAIPMATDAMVSMEYSDDMVVVVKSKITTGGAGVAPEVYTSRDGGVTFALTGTSSSTGIRALRTCVTPTGRILASAQSLTSTQVIPVIPGGSFGSSVSGQAGCNNDITAIAARDDGTVWLFGLNSSGAGAGDIQASVSLDDGATFTLAAATQQVFDLHDTPAANPFISAGLGSYRGSLAMTLLGQADTGSDNNIYWLTWGGWESVTDKRIEVTTSGQPYEATYIPLDYPTAFGWVEQVYGAGATQTNQGPWNIVCDGTDASRYDAPAGYWSGAATDTKRIRLRVRVNSGGSTADFRSAVRFAISDTVNQQEVTLKFSTTAFNVVDGPLNNLGTATLDMTKWTDILIFYAHDADPGVSAALTIFTKQDADALWTKQIDNATVIEDAGGTSLLHIGTLGGGAIGVADWDLTLVGIADDDNGFAEGFTNPDDLAGRPLSAAVDYYAKDNLLIGGYNGGGLPGDTYTLKTTYEYGKASVWDALRPSKQLRSTQDSIVWAVVFDAGSTNVFSVEQVALFGSNARQITIEMNSTDAWGAPAVSQAMTTIITSGTVSATKGPGFFVSTGSPGWRPGQFRSDGDAHRFFVDVSSEAYEITDNTADTLYVEDVDLSGVAGAFQIYSDRAYKDLGSVNRYRYMRVLYASQPTADDLYRLGTLVASIGYTPALNYSHDFVDSVTPQVTMIETDGGYRASSRVGPRRYSLAMQWTPINALHPTIGEVGREIEDFYSAIEGSDTPIAFMRDVSDISTLGLYRVVGILSRPNLRGELSTGLARIDTLTLEEEL